MASMIVPQMAPSPVHGEAALPLPAKPSACHPKARLARASAQFVLLMLGFCLCGSNAGATEATSPTSILYADATIIDGTGAPSFVHQDLLVHGDRIIAVGATGSLDVAAGTPRIDLAGKFVIPGLIDTHVHLATPPDRMRAEATLKRDLYGGVTAVRDMADDLRAVGELARASLADEIAAPDIVYAALMAGPDFFRDDRVQAVSKGVPLGKAPWMQAIGDDTDIDMAITLARGTSASAIKIYADMPAERVKAITEGAHRQSMMVWAHSSVFPARPSEVIDAGPDSVSHACYLAYELQPVNLPAYEDRTPVREELLSKKGHDPVMARLFSAMRDRDMVLDATGSLFVKEDAKRLKDPKRRRLRCSGEAAIRLTRQAWKAGVAISTGTDSSREATYPWPEVHDELFFLVKQVGMSPLEAIRAATLIGARAAGREADMGSIQPGKMANFVILRADPLTNIENVRAIDAVVKRGRTYRRDDFRTATSDDGGQGDHD